MPLKIVDDRTKDNQIDEFTGLFGGSHGGTEFMYHELTSRLDPGLLDKFQIICSRFRKLNGKIPIFWAHDLFNDPEAIHLKDPDFRNQFKKIIFVSYWQFVTYNLGLGVPYSNSVILNNAIEPFKESKEIYNLDKPTDKINIIYHTTPHRGLEILVPVFDKLCETNDNLHLDVFSSFNAYGWPERDKPYEKLFYLCEQHPNITYHGYKDNTVVRDYLAKAHIFAYPCIWKETSCIAAMEAMSAKALVVCPNLGALPETVSNFGYVYHYDENPNIHANRFINVLSTAINNIQNPNIQKTLDAAKGRTDNLYNWDLRINEWDVLLKSLLG